MKEYTVKELTIKLLHIVAVCGTVGIALKFVTFFDHWVYFPSFPNVLDSVVLILSVVYLSWLSLRNNELGGNSQ